MTRKVTVSPFYDFDPENEHGRVSKISHSIELDETTDDIHEKNQNLTLKFDWNKFYTNKSCLEEFKGCT